MDRNIYMIYGKSPKEMTMQLMKAADIKSRIPNDASIVLKPNLVVARHPDEGATTHAGILKGVIAYLQENGFRKISIIESAWVGEQTPRAMTICGYDEVVRRYGVPFYDLKKDSSRRIDTKEGSMQICEKALDADYLINLPVLKGHCQTTMTCALKNCKGCIPDAEKRRFHTLGLHRPIAALAAALKPDLTIVDSLCGDLDFEEGGTPVQTERIYLGFDPVQLDVWGCRLMGIDPDDVPYIALAEKFGAGCRALDDGEIISLNEPRPGGQIAQPTGEARRLGRNVQADMACSACYGNLIHALHRMEKDGCKCNAHIVIGQGFKGRKVDAVGIGQCCSGAARFAGGCPPSAQAIREVLEKQD